MLKFATTPTPATAAPGPINTEDARDRLLSAIVGGGDVSKLARAIVDAVRNDPSAWQSPEYRIVEAAAGGPTVADKAALQQALSDFVGTLADEQLGKLTELWRQQGSGPSSTDPTTFSDLAVPPADAGKRRKWFRAVLA